MNIKDAKKRLTEDVAKLNKMNHGLVFEIRETDYSIGLENHGKRNESCHYGAFEFNLLFEEFSDKLFAYQTAVGMVTLLISGTRLLEPASYHNVKEVA